MRRPLVLLFGALVLAVSAVPPAATAHALVRPRAAASGGHIRRPTTATGAAATTTTVSPATSIRPSVSSLTGFSGTSDYHFAPPDANLGVGNSQVVEVTNSTISVYAESGGSPSSTGSLNTFYSPPTGYAETDARILWDPASQRWYMSALLFDGTLSTCGSYVKLAVSKTATASAASSNWNIYQLSHQAADLQDQPRIGFSSDKILVSWDDFMDSGTGCGSGGVGASLIAVNKANVLAGTLTTMLVVNKDTNRFAIVPAVDQDSTETSTAYAVYNNSDVVLVPSPSGSLGVIKVTGVPGVGGGVSSAESDPALAAGTAFPVAAAEKGDTKDLDTNDDRVLNAVVRGGLLWTAVNVACAANSALPCSHFIEADVAASPMVINQEFESQTGDIFPAVTFDSSGNLMASATYTSSSTYPSIDEMFLPSGDTGSTQLETTRIVSGAGTYSYTSSNGYTCSSTGTSCYRWGDFSGAAIDPNNAGHAWITAEYAPSTSSTWGTWIAQVESFGVASVSPSSGSVTGGTTVTVNGWGLASSTAVTFGGTSVSSTVLSDTQVQAITPAASAGVVNVTVTTPAGTTPTSTADQFTYYPQVTGVAATGGPMAGGTTVTISGSGFTGASAVIFGGTNSASSTVVSDSVIKAVSPLHALGTVDVVVKVNGVISPSTASDHFTYNTNLVTMDAYGGIHPVAGATMNSARAPYWGGWNIARGIAVKADAITGAGTGGFTLDGWGGVHAWGTATGGARYIWGNWDIARGIVINPCDATANSGYFIDGWGGIHSFNGAPGLPSGPAYGYYWKGWDIARGLALYCPSGATVPRGYLLDGWGGIHPINGAPAVCVSKACGNYWGWDIARGIVVKSDGSGGYTLDGYGGIHRFGSVPSLTVSAYWGGWDIAHAITYDAALGGGYVVDGWGGVHRFGSAPAVAVSKYSYYPGWDIVKKISGG